MRLYLPAVAAVAFLAKCLIAFTTYGTNDVTTWQADLAKLSTEGAAALYRDGVQFLYNGRPWPDQAFSHPPAMVHVLYFWGFLASLTGLPLQFWMRFSCAIADAVSVFVVWQIAQRRPDLRISQASLMLLAACPMSIMISGFHGNTDPIMICFLLISVYFVEAAAPVLAGLFFGLALCVKIVPVIFGIAFLLYLTSLKSRLRFLVAAAGIFIAASLPYLATDPTVIIRSLAKYSGMPGIWSATLLVLGISVNIQKAAVVTLVGAISILMNTSRLMRPSLFVQVGTITSLFLALAPGFAVQYLAWSIPWIVCLGTLETLIYFLAGGTAVAWIYTHWCGGFPWYRAQAVDSGPIGALLLCWLALAATLPVYTRLAKNSRRAAQ